MNTPTGWRRVSDGAIPPPEVQSLLTAAWNDDWFKLGPVVHENELYETLEDGAIRDARFGAADPHHPTRPASREERQG